MSRPFILKLKCNSISLSFLLDHKLYVSVWISFPPLETWERAYCIQSRYKCRRQANHAPFARRSLITSFFRTWIYPYSLYSVLLKDPLFYFIFFITVRAIYQFKGVLFFSFLCVHWQWGKRGKVEPFSVILYRFSWNNGLYWIR